MINNPIVLMFKLFVGFIMFLFGFGLLYCYYAAYKDRKLDKERQEKIKNYCNKNGLIYCNDCSKIPQKFIELGDLNYFGNKLIYLNVISGNRDGFDFYIIDKKYKSGFGKNSSISKITCCLLLNNNINMPKFYINDENDCFEAIGKLLGGQDINFDEDQIFSKKFVLSGDNEELVRQFFTDKVRESFVKNYISGYSYCGYEEGLLLYIYDEQFDLVGLMRLLNKTLSIYKVITSEHLYKE